MECRNAEDTWWAIGIWDESWLPRAGAAALRIHRRNEKRLVLIALIHDGAQLSLWEKRRHDGHLPCIPRGRRRRPLAELTQARGGVRTPRNHRLHVPDPQGSKRVGMMVEIPDFAAFQEFMQTEPAAEAMKHDGVHPDTLVILAEG